MNCYAMKLSAVLAVIAINIYATNGLGTSSCDCFNPVLIDTPETIGECYLETTYLNQVAQNYKTIIDQVSKAIANNILKCDVTNYLKIVNGMRNVTEGIVLAYFSSTDDNCEQLLSDAYINYGNYRTIFDKFTQCAFTNNAPQCGQMIMELDPLVFVSGENLMTSFMACCKLRRGESTAPVSTSKPLKSQLSLLQLLIQLLSGLLPPKAECNCINLGARPIPTSEAECYSTAYITKITKFINTNFDKIENEYSAPKGAECEDYTVLLQSIRNFRTLASQLVKLIDISNPTGPSDPTGPSGPSQNPTFADVDKLDVTFNNFKTKYNVDVRAYIVNNDKACYSRVRKLRPYPMSIVDGVITAITQCVGYRDPLNQKCTDCKCECQCPNLNTGFFSLPLATVKKSVEL